MDPDVLANPLGTLASHGLLGSMLVVVAYMYWRKDKALQDCMNDRTREAVEATKLMVEGNAAMKVNAEAVKENTKAVQELLARRVR